MDIEAGARQGGGGSGLNVHDQCRLVAATNFYAKSVRLRYAVNASAKAPKIAAYVAGSGITLMFVIV